MGVLAQLEATAGRGVSAVLRAGFQGHLVCVFLGETDAYSFTRLFTGGASGLHVLGDIKSLKDDQGWSKDHRRRNVTRPRSWRCKPVMCERKGTMSHM